MSYHVISTWRLYQKTNINSHGLSFFYPSPSQLTLRDGAMQLRSTYTPAVIYNRRRSQVQLELSQPECDLWRRVIHTFWLRPSRIKSADNIHPTFWLRPPRMQSTDSVRHTIWLRPRDTRLRTVSNPTIRLRPPDAICG